MGVKRDRIDSCFNSCLFYKTFSDYDEIMLEMQEIQDVLPPFVCFKFVGIVIKIEPSFLPLVVLLDDDLYPSARGCLLQLSSQV